MKVEAIKKKLETFEGMEAIKSSTVLEEEEEKEMEDNNNKRRRRHRSKKNEQIENSPNHSGNSDSTDEFQAVQKITILLHPG